MTDALPAYELSRDIFLNVGGPSGTVKYAVLAMLIAAGVFLIRDIRHLLRRWNAGGVPGAKAGFRARAAFVIGAIVAAPRYRGEKYFRAAHLLSLTGVLLLVAGGGAFVLDAYLIQPITGYQAVTGWLYRTAALLSDAGSLLFALGITTAWLRRRSRAQAGGNVALSFGLVLAVIWGVFCADAARIALYGRPSWEAWGFISFALSFVLSPLSPGVLETLHFLFAWGSFSAAVLAVAILIRTPAGEIIRIWISIFRTDPASLQASARYGMEPASRSELSIGAYPALRTAGDLSSRDRSALEGCNSCGICDSYCPATLTETPLSPRRIAEVLRDASLAGSDEYLVGGKIAAAELWSCTSCGLCSSVCPAFIDFNSIFARLKRNQTLTEGSLPTEVKTNLVRVNRSGSLYGNTRRNFDLLRDSGGVRYDRHEWYLFAGCALKSGNNLDALKSFLAVCRRAGVSVGMLPDDEHCCGDYALRAGDDLLFEQSASKNIALFAREGITRIVTLCPHGYNALRKDYRALAAKSGMRTYDQVQVLSHVELMATLLREQRISLRHNPGRHIAWHDPCFLGRYNDLYQEPRELLRAVAGPFLVEMFHSREHGFCCGAYGSHHSSESMSEFRVKETVSSGATMLISACAHCRMGFDAAIQRHQLENIETMDIATYIAENMN